jgi:hypothetical protein
MARSGSSVPSRALTHSDSLVLALKVARPTLVAPSPKVARSEALALTCVLARACYLVRPSHMARSLYGVGARPRFGSL